MVPNEFPEYIEELIELARGKMNKQEWMIMQDDIPNWNSLPPYRQQLVDVAEIAQKKLLKHLIGFSNNQRRDFSVSNYQLGLMLDELGG